MYFADISTYINSPKGLIFLSYYRLQNRSDTFMHVMVTDSVVAGDEYDIWVSTSHTYFLRGNRKCWGFFKEMKYIACSYVVIENWLVPTSKTRTWRTRTNSSELQFVIFKMVFAGGSFEKKDCLKNQTQVFDVKQKQMNWPIALFVFISCKLM